MQSHTVEFVLLDAPQPWLLKLISGQYLDSASKLSLFQTCKQLNEMVLQHSEHTTFNLDPLSEPVDTGIRKLQAVSRHAPKIKLGMVHPLPGGKWCTGWSEDFKTVGRTICSFLQAAHKQGATTSVSSLQLKNAEVDALLPPSIGQACPSLTSLSLHRCHINAKTASMSEGGFEHLQSLELRDVLLIKDIDRQHLQAQLHCLTALQSLTIAHEEYEQLTRSMSDASLISSVVGQLTHLHLAAGRTMGLMPEMRLVLVRLGTTLRHLQLGLSHVFDDDLRMLLDMPFLTHVEAVFSLKTSFKGQPCKWQELTSSGMTLESLAFLPLQSGLLVKVKGQQSATAHLSVEDLEVDETISLAVQAADNIGKAKGLQWHDQSACLSVDMPDIDAVEFAEVLTYTLPLLSGVRQLEIDVQEMHLTGEAVQALRKFVCDSVALMSLDLGYCSIEAEHAVSLVMAMPCGSDLKLCIGTVRTEQMMTQMCCAAQRALTLHVDTRAHLLPGYKKRIMLAMQSCGHQHVELVMT